MSDRADHRRLNPAAAISAAVRGLPALWRGAWAALAFLTLLMSAPVLAPMTGGAGVAYGLILALGVLTAWGALTRIALGQKRGLGAGGVQFGAGELRIAWGLTLNLIFLAMIVVVTSLAALAVFGASGLDTQAVNARRFLEAGPPWKLAVMALTGLIALAVPVLLFVRLSLFAPASIGRGQTVALNSMGIASGAFWPLAGLWLLIAGGLAGVLWASAAPGPVAGRLAAAVALPWLWGPLSAGVLAAAYAQLEYWSPARAD